MSNFLLLAGAKPIVHIHIPKTGGSSIRGGTAGPGIFGHKNYEGPYYGTMPDRWKPRWKFAFVRHPMQRWWSAYRDWKFLRGYTGTPDDFAAETLAQTNPAQWNSIAHHTQPQTDKELCLARADTVFRYSPGTYEDDVAVICEKAGLRVYEKVKRLRETPSGVSEPLSATMEKRLAEFYGRDFEELGYAD